MSDQISVEEILQERERRWLRVPVTVRVVFGLFGAITAGVSGLPFSIGIFIYSAVAFLVISNAWFLYLLRDARHLRLVSYGGLVSDAASLLAYAAVQYYAVGAGLYSPALLAKTPTLLVATMMIVINTLTLRPRLPIAATAIAVLVQGAIIGLSLLDGRTQWSSDPQSVFYGQRVSMALLVNQGIYLLIIGSALVTITSVARGTLKRVVELQAAQLALQRQAMLGRLRALTKFVAAMSHELNTPVGAIRSTAQTTRTAAERLRNSVETSKKTTRILAALDNVADTAEQASGRIDEVVGNLRRFVDLDGAQLKSIDIHQAIDGAIDVIGSRLRGDCVVRRAYGELPQLLAHAGQVSQVLLTILTNAFEAVGDGGEVTVVTLVDHGFAEVQIVDNGPGMTEEQLATLFDFDLTHKDARVGTSFGLPACQLIMNNMSGDLSIESEKGKGTTVRIRFPIDKSESPSSP